MTSLQSPSVPEMAAEKAAPGKMIWLTEADFQDEGLMASAGLADLASSSAHQWTSTNPDESDRVATYISKLRRLREELLYQENQVLSDALERIRFQTTLRQQAQNSMLRRSRGEPVVPSSPSLHKQLQAEKYQQIEDRRKLKTPPKLKTLTGTQLIKPKNVSNLRTQPTGSEELYLPHGTSETHDIIERQRTRLLRLNGVVGQDVSRGSERSGTGSKSRTSLPDLNSSSSARSDTFYRQMSQHQKNPNIPGVYKSIKARPKPASDRNNVNLCLEIQSLETDQSRGEVNSDRPASIPAYLENLNLKGYDLNPFKVLGGGPLLSTRKKQKYPVHVSPKDQADRLESEYLSIVERENLKRLLDYHNEENKHAAPPVTPMIPGDHVISEDHVINGYDRLVNQPEADEKSACVMCQSSEENNVNLFLSGSKVDRQVRAPLDSARDNTFLTNPPEVEKHLTNGLLDHKIKVTDVDSEGHGIPAESTEKAHKERDVSSEQSNDDIVSQSTLDSNENWLHSSRRRLVVSLPDISLCPPTPTKSKRDDVTAKSYLGKAMKQNELRQREVSNLLEDIKELNQLADTQPNGFH